MRLFFCATILICAQTAASPLRFDTTSAGTQVTASLPADLAEKLPAGLLTQAQGEAALTVSLLENKTPGPTMLGKYQRMGNELTFLPRFPFTPGATYRASLIGNKLTLDYTIPALAAKAPPKVVKIYPTTDVLPANHLRFYIYFDRPMRGGKELFKHLAILNERGKEITEPWLVDEIWDEANNCLILFIHPGRIKWGVELRQLLGPVLREDQSYTFVVRGEWTDLEGNKIGKDVTKKFQTTFEDRVRIDLRKWKLSTPKIGTRDTLEMTLSQSIDYRSLHTGLAVVNAQDQVVDGKIEAGKDEKSWRFTPSRPWSAGDYHVKVDPDLEDICGNTPARAFDFDLQAPPLPAQNLNLMFRPK